MITIDRTRVILPELDHLLKISSAEHKRICPRQVLGVRIGIAGLEAVNIQSSEKDENLIVIVETDGCFVDGIKAATGAAIGHRTLRVEDYGKVAATFVNIATEEAVRVTPHLDVRERAIEYAPGEDRRYFIMLEGYQRMPTKELLSFQSVHLNQAIGKIISRPGIRTKCGQCGEEIINEREISKDGEILCKPCSGSSYYSSIK